MAIRRSSDLAVVMLIASLAMILVLLAVNIPVLRIAFTLPLALILPGYALTAALFPSRTLGRAERLLFTIGLSLAVAMLSGIVLNLTPWGLTARWWAAVLGGTSLGASAIALRRRSVFDAPAPARRVGVDIQQLAIFGLAAAIVGAAVVVARMPARQQGIQGYTVLWMLPSDDRNQNVVRLGLNSMEFSSVQYRLQVKVGNTVVHEWPAIDLATGQHWQAALELPGPEAATGDVEALLYRADAPAVIYRRSVLRRGSNQH